jgi:two-component system, LytTR family, sensor histidine kinase AlgZ
MIHPILSNLRSLLWYAFAWGIAGVVFAWLLVETNLAGWAEALLFALPVMPLYGFMLTSAYYVCSSLPLPNRAVVQVVVVFGCASLLSAAAWLGLCLIWFNIIGDLHLTTANVQINQQLSIVLFVGASLLYLVSLFAHDVFIAFKNIRAAERQQAASQLLAQDAELQMLRSQINPHFLFNSLNSISALTSIDASAARSMAIELGSFYRKTLTISARQKISFAEEVELCKHFLAVEKIRFGEKLQTKLELEPASFRAQVPAMFMQPLIENAIKHGICNLSEGGVIHIKSVIENNWLHIAISNPIESEVSAAIGTAIGLKNFKARIHNLYQQKARVSWYKGHDHFYLDMIIPFEPVMDGSRNE